MRDLSLAASSEANPARTSTSTGYIRTLDGWRAVAVWAVIVYHSRWVYMAPFGLGFLHDFCARGVQLFFAISGILICSRLLEEQRLTGSISLKGFYIRRVFRIQPPAVVYLLIVGIVGIVGILPQMFFPWLSSLFCFRNLYAAAHGAVPPNDRYTEHFWSLAVEEHFYLILPFLLVVVKKRAVQILGVLSAVFFIWPIIAIRAGLPVLDYSSWRTDLVLRFLLLPAFLAALCAKPVFMAWFTKAFSNGPFIAFIIFVILSSQLFRGGLQTDELCCIGLPLMVLSTMLNPQQWLGRILETRLFSFMGRISYSLYLWQQLFFIHRPEFSVLRFLQAAPWNVIALLTCAILSYYAVERPLIRIGHRLAPPVTAGHSDLRDIR